MKCRCCEKEINEENSVQGVCLECNNEIIKRIKINEIVDNAKQNIYKSSQEKKNKSVNTASTFLIISIFFNLLGIFSILAIIYAIKGILESDEHGIGFGSSVTMLILGVLVTLYQWFLAPTIALNLLS